MVDGDGLAEQAELAAARPDQGSTKSTAAPGSAGGTQGSAGMLRPLLAAEVSRRLAIGL